MRHETGGSGREASFDRASSLQAGATIRKLPAGLASLPTATEADFGSRPPWSVIPTGTAVADLGADRGNWATWRCRGIGPAELPLSWFRPATGRPIYYRIDTLNGWLASRRGEPFSAVGCWDRWLRTKAGLALPDAAAVRAFARRWAEGDGPVLDGGLVRFTKPGFAAYLASLGDAP